MAMQVKMIATIIIIEEEIWILSSISKKDQELTKTLFILTSSKQLI